ncbi:hypothetical protein BT63DRAFT_203726 [Microthyrium microscopicum]|uniref:Uncharacterized protein n=1 Tax=Microthyrium microscopicum TaxID=703497 RepID=A0A6A6UFE1_9PEZI|nr:hypothetical protein BT63DRAFT_203726 [Microthyrium microscopicum]
MAIAYRNNCFDYYSIAVSYLLVEDLIHQHRVPCHRLLQMQSLQIGFAWYSKRYSPDQEYEISIAYHLQKLIRKSSNHASTNPNVRSDIIVYCRYLQPHSILHERANMLKPCEVDYETVKAISTFPRQIGKTSSNGHHRGKLELLPLPNSSKGLAMLLGWLSLRTVLCAYLESLLKYHAPYTAALVIFQ